MIDYKPYVGPRSQKNTKHTLQHIVVRRREDDDAYRIKDKLDPESYAEKFPCIIPWTRPELYEVPVDVTSGTSKATKFDEWYKKNKDKYKNRARAMEAYKMGVGRTESTRYGNFKGGMIKSSGFLNTGIAKPKNTYK